MNEADKNILQRAIKINGKDAQLLVAMEECAELIQAISHYLRKRNPTNLVEEIADVNIMIHQMKLMFGEGNVREMVDFKVNRLSERLEKQ